MLKPLGIIRKVDELGRITLPIGLRRSMGIKAGDRVAIFVSGKDIIVSQHDNTVANTRKLDELGRVTIPIEMRHTMNIAEGVPLEIYVDGKTAVLRRYDNAIAIIDDLQRIASRVRDEMPTETASKIDALIRQIGEVMQSA